MRILIAFCALFAVSQATVLGGWETMNVDDKETKALALAAVQEVDAMSNSLYRNKIVKILEAKSQIVAGMKYLIKMELAETECSKHEDRDLAGCRVTRPSQICSIEYWVQPWTKTQQITEYSCKVAQTPTGTTTKPHLVGGADDADPGSSEVKDAAGFAVDAINAQSNSLYRAQLLRVKQSSKQTVAGVKYSMVIEIGFSFCRNTPENQGAALSKCPVDEHRATQECSIEVLDQQWADPRYKLISHSCQKQDLPEENNDHNNVLKFPSNNDLKDKKPLLGGDGHDIGNHGSFLEFKQKYNKQYSDSDEEVRRFKTFQENMKTARKLQDLEQGTATYGATKFADLTREEFRQYLGYRPDLDDGTPLPKADPIPASSAAPPAAFDWRDHNAVTPVKNQGSCGSCWAFSTTGNIEGQWAIHKSKLVSLSEQELVDCDKVDEGCNGGLPSNAYKVIQKLGGLETEAEYPYEGRDDKCEFKKQDVRVYINGSQTLSSDEKEMAAWLYKNGPISIGINAFAMQFYMGGVSHPWSFMCDPESLDHGVLIVGYGIHDGWFSKTPYWIVKNSWGENWGEKGYYLVYRGGGTCGLNKTPTSAIVN